MNNTKNTFISHMPTNKITQLSWAISACFLLTGCPQHETNIDFNSTEEASFLIRDVLQHVQDEYVDEIETKNLIQAALAGALSSLDPYSAYLSPADYKFLMETTRGEFGGIGLEVIFQKEGLVVVSPIEGMPAAKAGIKSKDIIIKINGTELISLTPQEAMHQLHGDVGSTVKLTIKRHDEEPFDVQLERAIIKDNPVKSFHEKGIGYIRLSFFNEKSDEAIRDALKSLRDAGPLKGIVFDLRNNPGGTLDQAVAVASIFIEKGVIVDIKSRHTQYNQTLKAKGNSALKDLPVVVMINGASASGSEVVAGAIKDHKRAVILGVKSFGKGSVQQVFPIPGYGGIKMTIAKFYTPDGQTIHGKGVEPDIVVEEKNHENSHEKAILGDIKTDYQLQRAFDLLRGIASLSSK